MNNLFRAICAVSAVLVFASGCKRDASSGAEKIIRVAAAADLAFAFPEIGELFEKKTGIKAIFTFGSTGQLAKQISEGAPYDVFAAANVSFVDDVIEADACEAQTKALYARGRIAVWSREHGPVTFEELAQPRYAKIAIANPEHAPYGRAAKEALEAAGVWEAVKPRLVYGENVRQTLQYAQTGNVEAAIAALSLTMVTEGGSSLVIDDKLHKPIEQALVVCKRGNDRKAAKAFAELVSSAEGRAVMNRYGFVLPGEAPSSAILK